MKEFFKFLFAVWKYRRELWKHKDSIITSIGKDADKAFDPELMSAFSDSLEIEKHGLFLKQPDIDAYCEEYMFRKLSCPDCVFNKECEHCECVFPEKMQTPSQFCPVGKWQRMEEDEGKTWKDFKEQMGITFELKYR